MAAIETSARECEVRGETDRAALLREASTTLRAVMRPDALRRAEPDIAALMEAEGVAMRPGPRPVLAAGVLPTLRRSILGMQLVVVRYAGPDAAEPATRILCPYGILYGGRGWLVAHVDGLPDMRLWRLDRIVSADLLDRGFKRREDFDLAAYAAQSFGVFQEEPIDVVLRFEPEAADDAAALGVPSLAEHGARGGRCADRAFSRRRRAGNVLASVHLGNGGGDCRAGGVADGYGRDGKRGRATTCRILNSHTYRGRMTPTPPTVLICCEKDATYATYSFAHARDCHTICCVVIDGA